MKKLIFLILTVNIISNAIFAQKNKEPIVIPKLPKDSITGLISYVKVEEVKGVDKNELYKRALGWANNYYKNPGDVIREKDAVAGKLLIKARYKIYNQPIKKDDVVTDAGDVLYTLNIAFKDNRYRYEITKFNWQQISAFPAERWFDDKAATFVPAYASYLQQTDDKVKEITNSLRKAMNATEIIKKDDW